MRILGLDPGLASVGWGLIVYPEGGPRDVRWGAIHTPASDPLPQRLDQIHRSVAALIAELQP
ncbi:MAG TPA: crossover junction endodeoxyribonuclease RuvC, partial [Candidatus Sumerlaeota bacterium]|nr:crossover junction endodeoxyribonuclease RuvC [Candidatus Sumerlaeota bacterium]